MNLHGIVTVLATPFDPNEAVDETSLRSEVDFAIDGGAVAVCWPAFGSEYYKLSDHERYQVSKIVVDQTAGRVPVVISTGAGSLYSTIEFSRYAESIGAQAIMVVPPRAVPIGPRELLAFYEGVCRSVKIPVMLQDADFGGGGLPASFFVDLSERCSNFRFAKLENVLPGEKCSDIIRLSRGKLDVLYGWGGLGLFDGLAHGARGIMPGAALVDVYTKVMRLHDSARVDDAKSLFRQLVPYLTFALQHLELFIYLEKRVLVRRGVLTSDRLREPTLYLDEQYRNQVGEMVDLATGLTGTRHRNI